MFGCLFGYFWEVYFGNFRRDILQGVFSDDANSKGVSSWL